MRQPHSPHLASTDRIEGQDKPVQITRSSIETQKGPADWFTGDVYIDAVAAPAGISTFAAASCTSHATQHSGPAAAVLTSSPMRQPPALPAVWVSRSAALAATVAAVAVGA
jgi:hypothetical protein